MPIKINHNFMGPEINGAVIATDGRRAGDCREVSDWPRLFDRNRNQAITALTVAEILDSGRHSSDQLVIALPQELR